MGQVQTVYDENVGELNAVFNQVTGSTEAWNDRTQRAGWTVIVAELLAALLVLEEIRDQPPGPP